MRADSAIIDIEIVAIDDNGVPCFDELRKSRRSCAVVFHAFDLLKLNGEESETCHYLKRKSLLKRIVRRTKTNRIRFTDYIVGNGLALFAQLERQRLEGMVAKKVDSKHESGRMREWLKIKTSADKEEIRKRIENW